jgi:hypothetical protein
MGMAHLEVAYVIFITLFKKAISSNEHYKTLKMDNPLKQRNINYWRN